MPDLPFRLTSAQPGLALDRVGGARFEAPRGPDPSAVEKASKDAGRPLQEVAREARVADHAVPAGAPKNPATGGFRATLPWPEPPGQVLPVRFRQ